MRLSTSTNMLYPVQRAEHSLYLLWMLFQERIRDLHRRIETEPLYISLLVSKI